MIMLPMITRFILGNFKAIRDPIEIDLRPITLLFGPNAAGKSSILQAIHYAIEILEGRSLDTHQTRLGREHVNLGGFSNLVHNHDLASSITIGFEQRWDKVPGAHNTILDDLPVDDEVGKTAQAEAIRGRIFAHRIVWRVGHYRNNIHNPPTVTECDIDLNDEPIASLRFVTTEESPQFGGSVVKLNCRHPLFASAQTLVGEDSRVGIIDLAEITELVLSALGESPEDVDGRVVIPLTLDRPGESVDGMVSVLPLAQSRALFSQRIQLDDVSVKPRPEDEYPGNELARDRLFDILNVILIEPMIPLTRQPSYA